MPERRLGRSKAPDRRRRVDAEHLHRKKKAQKARITVETLDLVEAKKRAFSRWRERRTDVRRGKEYVDSCKTVRRVMRRGKEKWLDGTMKGMEEEMRHNRRDRFFKKMKRLMNSRVTPVDTILDKAGQPVQQAEEKMSQWRRHFHEILNVDSAVSEEVVADLEDNSHTPEVNREEVERAVKKLQNKRAAGYDRIVAELVKNGGKAMIDKRCGRQGRYHRNERMSLWFQSTRRETEECVATTEECHCLACQGRC